MTTTTSALSTTTSDNQMAQRLLKERFQQAIAEATEADNEQQQRPKAEDARQECEDVCDDEPMAATTASFEGSDDITTTISSSSPEHEQRRVSFSSGELSLLLNPYDPAFEQFWGPGPGRRSGNARRRGCRCGHVGRDNTDGDDNIDDDDMEYNYIYGDDSEGSFDESVEPICDGLRVGSEECLSYNFALPGIDVNEQCPSCGGSSDDNDYCTKNNDAQKAEQPPETMETDEKDPVINEKQK